MPLVLMHEGELKLTAAYWLPFTTQNRSHGILVAFPVLLRDGADV